MPVDDIVREIETLFSLNAAVIARASALFAELKSRGVTITIRSSVFRTLIPQVAEGKLAAEAVAAFAHEPKVLRAVAHFEIAEQIRLAGGGTIEVLPEAGKATVPMTVREVVRRGFPAIVAGKILTAEQQRVQLIARERSAKNATPSAPRTPPPSEREVEALVAAVNAELAKRNTNRPTVREFVEIALMLGLRPAKGTSRV